MPYLSQLPGGIVAIRLYVQPKASKTRLMGLHDGQLKIAIASPPVDGKANKAVQLFFAKALSIAKTDVVIKAGAHSRRKTIAVKSVSVPDIRAIVTKLLDGGS